MRRAKQIDSQFTRTGQRAFIERLLDDGAGCDWLRFLRLELDGRPRAGDKWKFALCRCDYSAYLERPELSSTAALAEPDFHRYEDYGELTFVGSDK